MDSEELSAATCRALGIAQAHRPCDVPGCAGGFPPVASDLSECWRLVVPILLSRTVEFRLYHCERRWECVLDFGGGHTLRAEATDPAAAICEAVMRGNAEQRTVVL